MTQQKMFVHVMLHVMFSFHGKQHALDKRDLSARTLVMVCGMRLEDIE